jgi:hypothetical protein
VLDNLVTQKFDHYWLWNNAHSDFRVRTPSEITRALFPMRHFLFYGLSNEPNDITGDGLGRPEPEFPCELPEYLCVWLLSPSTAKPIGGRTERVCTARFVVPARGQGVEVGDTILVEHDDLAVDYEMLLAQFQRASTISGKYMAQSWSPLRSGTRDLTPGRP